MNEYENSSILYLYCSHNKGFGHTTYNNNLQKLIKYNKFNQTTK